MDTTFMTGSAAFISAIIVFVGSVWLLLALLMGGRLAYMIVASVTLAFVLMMGLVWSYGDPLGPVGEMPEWNTEDIGTDQGGLGFGPASDYPEGDWHAPEEGDTRASDLESSATDYLEVAIGDDEVTSFESPSEAQVEPESARLLEQGGTTYGMVTFLGLEGTPTEDADPVYVVMQHDPGNPSGPARMITAGTFIVFLGHLIGLSRMERKAARKKTDENDDEA